jgi:hypothetical protein
VFGVTMEQAVTADGHPHLVPRLHA